MNDRRLEKLFRAARQNRAPAAPEGFDQAVMRSTRSEARLGHNRFDDSLFDQLNRLFPRLAFAAALMITLCVAADFLYSSSAPSFTDSVAQLSEQWLFASNGF